MKPNKNKIIYCLPEIQIHLGILQFYLLNLATLAYERHSDYI